MHAAWMWLRGDNGKQRRTPARDASPVEFQSNAKNLWLWFQSHAAFGPIFLREKEETWILMVCGMKEASLQTSYRGWLGSTSTWEKKQHNWHLVREETEIRTEETELNATKSFCCQLVQQNTQGRTQLSQKRFPSRRNSEGWRSRGRDKATNPRAEELTVSRPR